jgi:AcrR family transcriptional regulator
MPTMASPPEQLSLRARKKTRTRQQIADAAATLFSQKGFDGVTVAEIARLADVSEQTVYNFFPSKEQLVLDEDGAFQARLVAMIRQRPTGTSLADAVRAGVHAFLDELSRRPKGPQNAGGLPCLINVSPTLRRAWLEAVERYADAIARALVDDSSGALSAPAAKILGHSIVAVFHVVIDEIGRGTKERVDIGVLIETLRPQVDDALNRIAQGTDFTRTEVTHAKTGSYDHRSGDGRALPRPRPSRRGP